MEREGPKDYFANPVNAGIVVNDLRQVILPGVSYRLINLIHQRLKPAPADGLLDCHKRIGSSRPSFQHGPGHIDQRPGGTVDCLRPANNLFLVLAIGLAEHAANHLVEHRDRSIGQLGFHLAGEDHQRGKPPLTFQTGQMLSAEDGCLPGNPRVAGPVNAPLAIRLDAQRAHDP
nr:hypothetical protein [Microvirga roseola]